MRYKNLLWKFSFTPPHSRNWWQEGNLLAVNFNLRNSMRLLLETWNRVLATRLDYQPRLGKGARAPSANSLSRRNDTRERQKSSLPRHRLPLDIKTPGSSPEPAGFRLSVDQPENLGSRVWSMCMLSSSMRVQFLNMRRRSDLCDQCWFSFHFRLQVVVTRKKTATIFQQAATCWTE